MLMMLRKEMSRNKTAELEKERETVVVVQSKKG
jgi:hypothetical protein